MVASIGQMTDSDKISKLREAFGNVYDFLQGKGDDDFDEKMRQEFIFHMEECFDDFEEIVEVMRDSERVSEETAQRVAGFIYHVVPHLRRAGRLLLDEIPDPFNGADE